MAKCHVIHPSFDIRKCPDPTALLHICGGDEMHATNGQKTGVARRRVGGIRESVLPRVDFGGTVYPCVTEKVFSCARNPRSGNEATLSESFWFVVDNAFADFLRAVTSKESYVDLRKFTGNNVALKKAIAPHRYPPTCPRALLILGLSWVQL